MSNFTDWLGSHDIFDQWITDSHEQQQAADHDRANQLTDDYLANTPDAYAMGGFGLFGATPEQLQANPLYGLGVNDQSALAGVKADPRLVQSQMGALGQLEQIGAAGGYTDAERAQMGNMQRDAGNIARSRRLAAQSQAEARGMGRGGASLMGALQAGQGGANAASAAANQTAIAAQQRALGAIESAGSLSGQMRGQGFNEASQGASAADAWNRGNTALIMQRQQALADGTQAADLANRAGTAMGTNQYNDSAQYNEDQANAPGEQRREVTETFASFFGGGGGGGG
jgi:hypothetical protein